MCRAIQPRSCHARPNTRFEVPAEDSLATLGSSVRSLRSLAPQPQRYQNNMWCAKRALPRSEWKGLGQFLSRPIDRV